VLGRPDAAFLGQLDPARGMGRLPAVLPPVAAHGSSCAQPARPRPLSCVVMIAAPFHSGVAIGFKAVQDVSPYSGLLFLHLKL
jgi:hypothetical protein